MQKPALTLFIGLFGLSLAGCASFDTAKDTDSSADTEQTQAQAPAAQPSQPTKIEYADFEPEVLYLLLSGEIAAQRGRYDVTLVNYLKAAKQSRDVA